MTRHHTSYQGASLHSGRVRLTDSIVTDLQHMSRTGHPATEVPEVKGSGTRPENYGPSRAGRILSRQDHADKAIEAVVERGTRQGGASQATAPTTPRATRSRALTSPSSPSSSTSQATSLAPAQAPHLRQTRRDRHHPTAHRASAPGHRGPGHHRRLRALLSMGTGHGSKTRNRTGRGRVGTLHPRRRDRRRSGQSAPEAVGKGQSMRNFGGQLTENHRRGRRQHGRSGQLPGEPTPY